MFVPCSQCQKPTAPILGPVCAKCCRANHRSVVTGKQRPVSSRAFIRLTLVLAYLGAQNHSGQFSRGYRLWCMAFNRCKRQGIQRPLDTRLTEEERRLLAVLESRYGNVL